MRYFIVFFTGVRVDIVLEETTSIDLTFTSLEEVEEETLYHSNEPYADLKFPNMEDLENQIKEKHELREMAFTNIVELSEDDFLEWVRA